MAPHAIDPKAATKSTILFSEWINGKGELPLEVRGWSWAFQASRRELQNFVWDMKFHGRNIELRQTVEAIMAMRFGG